MPILNFFNNLFDAGLLFIDKYEVKHKSKIT